LVILIRNPDDTSAVNPHRQSTYGPVISGPVGEAIAGSKPVVGIETAFLTHGLPRPMNIEVMSEVLRTVRDNGAVSAAVGILKGKLVIGLDEEGLKELAYDVGAKKCALRDLPLAISSGSNGGATVSATAWSCRMAGIEVMATGGIGGAHRGWQATADISQDIAALAVSGVLCVCSGPKSVLDVRATYEMLESSCVPMVTCGSPYLPAFLSSSSGIGSAHVLSGPEEIARAFLVHRSLGAAASMVVANPVDEESSIPLGEVEEMLFGDDGGLMGPEVTPALLADLARSSGGRSLETNRRLLVSNARLAAEVASALAGPLGPHINR